MADALEQTTVGQKLLSLKARSGLSLAQIAGGAGYGSASAIQRFFNERYAPSGINFELAGRLADALEGSGNPAITRDEVSAAFALGSSMESVNITRRVVYENTSAIVIRATERLDLDLEDIGLPNIETFSWRFTKQYIYKPSHLRDKVIFGFHVPVISLSPRYEYGEFAIFEADKLVKVGDFSAVRLRRRSGDKGVNFIAKVLEISPDQITFEQFRPNLTFSVGISEIELVHRIMTLEELLPPMKAG